MAQTIYISYRFENATMGQRIGTYLGVSVHLQCLVVNLDDNRIKFAGNCQSHFKNVTRINSCLGSFTVFSRKIFRWCLTFDAVYI